MKGKRPTPSHLMNRRCTVLMGFFILGFAVLCARLVKLQIIDHAIWQARAGKIHSRTVTDKAVRGRILDRSGSELAINFSGYELGGHPRKWNNVDATLSLISQQTGLTTELLQKKVEGRGDYARLDDFVTPDVAERIKKLNLKGMVLTPVTRRYYPNSPIGSPLLGLTDSDGVGVEGLEYALNDMLAGQDGINEGEVDGRGRLIPHLMRTKRPRVDGSDIRTTISLPLQVGLEREVEEGRRVCGAKSGLGIIMDVHTGEILAMSSTPSFDANTRKLEKGGTTRMACVTDLYEMGSTIKPLAIAAALDSGKVKPGFSYYCQGKTKIGRRTIRCDSHAPFRNGHKKQGLSGIVAHSCNLGTAQCFLISGAAVAKDYFERFGFTQLPGSEFRGERALKLPDPERWRPSELATRSYGHGIAVSPLHLITAYCALANGGFKVRPRLVLGQERSDGSFLPSRTVEQRIRILKPSTVRLVQSYLRAVVTEGTGQAAELAGYPGAGKTGTPQKLRPDGRGYMKGLVRAMFCGFAPADNPRVAVLVLYDEPQTSQYAAVVAAPVWRRVTQETLWRLKVPPSRGPEIKVARRRGD